MKNTANWHQSVAKHIKVNREDFKNDGFYVRACITLIFVQAGFCCICPSLTLNLSVLTTHHAHSVSLLDRSCSVNFVRACVRAGGDQKQFDPIATFSADDPLTWVTMRD